MSLLVGNPTYGSLTKVIVNNVSHLVLTYMEHDLDKLERDLTLLEIGSSKKAIVRAVDYGKNDKLLGAMINVTIDLSL